MHHASTLHWLAGVALALVTPAAVSNTATTTVCKVVASEELSYPSLVASYSGDCKDGWAEGQGVARWERQHYGADPAPIIWQGRFVNGIYLAEPDVLGARHLGHATVLMDLGPLAGPGHTGRLWTQSSAEGALPPSACHPFTLRVSTRGPLHDDSMARQWLDAAYQRWWHVCGAKILEATPISTLQVWLHEGDDWTSVDAAHKLPAGVVRARTALGTAAASAPANWQSYENRPAQRHAATLRQQAWEANLHAELQANERRLRDFARLVGAKRFVTLDVLQQNPFRFGDDVLLVDLRLLEAHTPSEARVRGTTGHGGRGGLLQGDIAQWDDASRMVAVRVIGRSSEPDTQGLTRLQLIDSRVCGRRDCDDFMVMPDKRRLKELALEE